MSTREARQNPQRSSLLFILLTAGLVVTIYGLHVAPTRLLLKEKRDVRLEFEERLAHTRSRWERLHQEAESIGHDPFVTERHLRRRGYGRAREVTLEPVGETGR